MQFPKLFQTKKKHNEAVLVRPSRIKSAFLLFLAVCLMVLAVIARIMTSSDEEKLAKLQAETEILTEARVAKENFREVKTIDSIGNFSSQVKPVSFDDIVLEKRSQYFEFKDAEYIVARKAAWTVEVMDVAEEDVILDFLSTAEKRDQFAYFRYIAEDKTKRYILIFDDFNDEKSALNAIEENNFSLPESIQLVPRSFKDYIGKVDSYHLQRNVKDYKRDRYREVVLRRTSAPIHHTYDGSYTVKSRYNTSHARNRVKPKTNAFSKQSGSKERVIQPKSERSYEATEIKPSATDVQNSNKTQSGSNAEVISGPNKPAIEKPLPQADNLSDLIDRIEE